MKQNTIPTHPTPPQKKKSSKTIGRATQSTGTMNRDDGGGPYYGTS